VLPPLVLGSVIFGSVTACRGYSFINTLESRKNENQYLSLSLSHSLSLSLFSSLPPHTASLSLSFGPIVHVDHLSTEKAYNYLTADGEQARNLKISSQKVSISLLFVAHIPMVGVVY